MEGLGFRVVDDFDSYFIKDTNGLYHPNKDKLLMEKISQKFRRQLNSDHGAYRRLAGITWNTDVLFPNNDLGNSAAIGWGRAKLGPRPLDGSVREGRLFKRRLSRYMERQLAKRQSMLRTWTEEVLAIAKDCEAHPANDREALLAHVEHDQALTGEGYDNNKIGDVTKSGLNFIAKGWGYDHSVLLNSDMGKLWVDQCLWLRDHLASQGLKIGSLKPRSALRVRAEQDTDGLLGYPVWARGHGAWTKEIADRILIEYSIDTRHLVGKPIHDKYNQYSGPARVVDGLAFCLDARPWTYEELLNLITLLARIQKHGCTEDENGNLEAKDGKTRSVYLNSAIPGMIEAMIFSPFIDAMKECKVDFMPSLQDKPTRIRMIFPKMIAWLKAGFDVLAADWSKYDAGVIGALLATMIILAIMPFFDAKYHYWVKVATYILVYKYVIIDKDLAKLNQEQLDKAKDVAPFAEVDRYYIFGMLDGLLSGAKLTHVGGSCYGVVLVHRVIPIRLGIKNPTAGFQGGDDTGVPYPQDRIDYSSAVATYTPMAEEAKLWNLDMNVSKQIFYQYDGELVLVFLQDSYHVKLDIQGVGSPARYSAAVFVTERDKRLNVPCQLCAEISRENNGADNPLAPKFYRWWLEKERYIGWLYKTYGLSAFKELTARTGMSVDELAKSIEVGSFSYGITKGQLRSGNLPINAVLVDVVKDMQFSSEDSVPDWEKYDVKYFEHDQSEDYDNDSISSMNYDEIHSDGAPVTIRI